MELTKETIDVLKNFASINQSLRILPGNVLATKSPSNSVMATVTLKDSFEVDFNIYDLPKFLGVVSMFENPKIDFDESGKFVTISKGTRKYKFLASPAPVKGLKAVMTLDPIITFTLNEVVLKEIIRAATISNLPTVALINDGEMIRLQVYDKDNTSTNSYSIDIRPSDDDNLYTMIFFYESFRFIPGDYKVVISKEKLAQFIPLGNTLVTYTVTLCRTSKYES